ncbi:MAG TPA: iron-containing alcohol dehydrogenase [Desulfomonilaceae bacterium]|nr:iron-containing alcohol dehydrogenase [Desulfomonilaceae bacterium]
MSIVTMFQTTPRMLMGVGSLNQLGEEAKRLGGSKVMIVTDRGLMKAGIVDRAIQSLESAGFTVLCFDDVEADPRYEIAIRAADAARRDHVEIMVGIGGGSSLDIAKVASILATNEGPVSSYFGIDLVPRRGLPMVLVPTTAGTGSEVTPIAILSDEHEKLKKGIVSQYLFPAVAILDPQLTVGLPPAVTAATGMDALIHAVEAYTSKNATWLTDMLAREAMSLIAKNIRSAFTNGTDLDARSKMLEGSLLAGIAFANAGVTAVHAFAYPIGAEFHIPHGVANSMMLVPVMEFNMLGNMTKFARMAELFGENTSGLSERDSSIKSVEFLKSLSGDLNIPSQLREFGVQDKDVPGLARGVMKVTRLLANNPRELTLKDAEEIYRKVL